MILSNVSIKEALDKGWLVISPEPTLSEEMAGRPECQFNTSAVDLRLSNEISIYKAYSLREGEKKPITIDFQEGKYSNLGEDLTEIRTITDDQPYKLRSNRLVLGETLEYVNLPYVDESKGPCLAARLEGRSSYGRCGLLVHFTAPTIHSGYGGHIKLEIMNLGPHPINLYPNARICQLIVEQVHGKPLRRDSQFHQLEACK